MGMRAVLLALAAAGALVPGCASRREGAGGSKFKFPTRQATPRVLSTLPVKNPFAVALTPDGSVLYLTQPGLPGKKVGNTLVYMTADKGMLLGTVTVGQRPVGLTMNREGTALFVVNETSGYVSRVDTAQNVVASQFATGRGPVRLALAPREDLAAVVNRTESSLALLSLSEQRVLVQIPCGYVPWDAAFSPDGHVIYASGGGGVGFYWSATGQALASIGGHSETSGMALSADGGTLYVGDRTSGSVLVVSPATAAIVAEIRVASGPTDLVLTPNGKWLYVVCEDASQVDVVSTAERRVVTSVFDLRLPGRVAVSPDGALAYVTMPYDDRVAVLATHDWPPPKPDGKKRGAAKGGRSAGAPPDPWEEDDRRSRRKKPGD